MPKISEIQGKIEATIPMIAQIAANAEVLACNDVLGSVADRIFTLGKRTDGSAIGEYKIGPYKQKRKNLGRQTSYVDFQFKGDLFNSLNVGVLNDKPAVGIVSEEQAIISDHLDKRFGITFQASIGERDKAIAVAREYLFANLKEVVKKWS